jgi:hypothetical protein
LTSNLIPFASHAANELVSGEEFRARFAELGTLMRASEMRLSGPTAQARPPILLTRGR